MFSFITIFPLLGRGPGIGFRGRVILPFEDNDFSKIGVRFDRSIPEGNNLGGFCEDDHGFFCTGDHLDLFSFHFLYSIGFCTPTFFYLCRNFFSLSELSNVLVTSLLCSEFTPFR